MKNKIVKCPICENYSKHIYSLNRDEIITNLKKYFCINEGIDEKIVEINYMIYKCTNCTFEFSEPKIAASNKFYDWITIQNPYYVINRWEYFKVIELLKNEEKSNSLIDIGCGDGNFLKLIEEQLKLKTVGIDFTNSAIQNCINKGISAYCCDVKEYIKLNPNTKFNYLTAFHVLEHIEDINEFIKDCKSLIKDEGSLFFSTPNCPTSYEGLNFDILNNPPHHLSRFNIRSYQELASKLNMELKIFMPDAQNFMVRAIKSTYLKYYSSQFPKFKKMLIKCIFLHFITVIYEVRNQYKREKYKSKTTADIILIQLKKK